MSRKIYYSGGRRIEGGGVEEGEETRRYRWRKAGGASAKERRRERDRDVKKALFFLKSSFYAK
jgi:hypothetical protein